MPRMFVEDTTAPGETERTLVSRLMRELDQAAAIEGHRVNGDVSILAYPTSAFMPQPKLRLEADVTPSV